MPKYVQRTMRSLSRDPNNARKDLGSEADVRALWRSRKKHQVQPLIISERGVILDGNRTHWGAELENDFDTELDCSILEGEPTPQAIRRMQLISAVHREGIRPIDQADTVREMEASGLTRKQIEAETEIDQGKLSKLMSIFSCKPEVIAAARDGKVGLTDWNAISRADDQLEALRLRLDGATVAQLAASVKKPTGERVKKLPIPITGDVCGLVTVSGLAGQDLDLDDTELLLKLAQRAVKDAKKRGYSANTFSKAQADMAAAAD